MSRFASLSGRILLLALVYFLAGRLALLLAIPPGFATAFFPPLGISLAAVLLWGNPLLGGVFLGSTLLNISIAVQAPDQVDVRVLLTAAGIATGSTIACACSASLIRRWIGFPNALLTEKTALKLLLVAGPLGSLLSASLGSLVLRSAGIVSAEQWLNTLWTWWVGDSIGVMLALPLMLTLFGQPAALWQRRRLTVGLPMVLCAALMVVLFIRSSQTHLREQALRFQDQGTLMAATLEFRLALYISALDSVRALYNASHDVSAEEFTTFTREFNAQYPGIQAMEWAPEIAESERETFEQAMRASGHAGFVIRERNPEGGLRPAALRAHHVPVQFIEPLQRNLSVIGFDLASEPLRLAALMSAKRSGRATMTAPVVLVQDQQKQPGFLVFRHVHTANAKGFAVAVVRVADMVGYALNNFAPNGYRLRIFDMTQAEPAVLFSNLDGPLPDYAREMVFTRDIGVGGRLLRLQFEPGEAFLDSARNLQAWLVLAAGLVLTTLLGVFLLGMTGRTEQIREEVQTARAALEDQNRIVAINARVQALFIREDNSRVAFEALLGELLQLTGSAYGFIGEVLRKPDGAPYLKTWAITNIAWNDTTRAFYAANAPKGMEFFNLKTLFGEVMTRGEPVISNAPAEDPRRGGLPAGHPALNNFLGIPVHHGQQLIAMVGLANRHGGYDTHLLAFLSPLLQTIGQLVHAQHVQRDRAEAQAQLASSQAELQQFFDGAKALLAIAGSDGHFRRISHSFSRLLGYSEAELLAEPFLSWVHPEDVSSTLREMARLGSGALTIDFRNRYRCADGHYVTLEWAAAPDARNGLIYATARDVTDLVETQTALQDNAARLRGLFELSPLGIALNDFHTGAFLDINDAMLAPGGYTREEFLALSTWQLTPQEYESQQEEQIRCLEETGRYGPYEKEYFRKDGSRYPVRLNGMVVSDAGGRKLIWSIIEDISDRKRVDRMKSEFVSTVSHELRTPLTAISGALALVASGALGSLPDKARDLIVTAKKNSSRLTTLINDLLDMEKLAAGKLRFDLQVQALMPLIDQAVQDNQAYAESFGVRFRIGTRADTVYVNVDAERFHQVLANLLSNAAKFSPRDEGVTVDVSVRGDRVCVDVQDRGPGIPENFRDRIFQKFAQADASDRRQKGGTGLGLAITHELVERMGGQISFDSTVGIGTCFHVSLPMAMPAHNSPEV